MGYSKVIHKKRVEKKWTSVRDIENNGYSDACMKKEKKRDEQDIPGDLAKIFCKF